MHAQVCIEFEFEGWEQDDAEEGGTRTWEPCGEYAGDNHFHNPPDFCQAIGALSAHGVLMCPVLCFSPYSLYMYAVLKPGYYAVAIATPSRAITAAALCPHGFVCPGAVPVAAFDPSDPTALSATEPSIGVCKLGMWTKDMGATAANACSK